MGKLDPQAFADFLMKRSAAKDGYIMCSVGQNPKKLSEWYYSGQYSGSQLTKARYWREHAEQVFDCQGMSDYFVTVGTGTKINVKARDNYSSWCGVKGTGVIPPKYRVPGAAVFMNSSYIHHVGYLVKPVDASNPNGDWWVVEARGVMWGVVTYKLSARDWNRWGLMDKYFDYSEVLEKYHGVSAPVVKYTLGSRLLKRGMTGEDVGELQSILIEMEYELAVTKTYDANTEAAVRKFQQSHYDLEVDGKYGEMTHAALMEAMREEEVEDEPAPVVAKKVAVTAAGRWNVRKGAGTNYGIVTVVSQGAEFPHISTAENGWLQIEINGGAGWLSNKCAALVE